MLLRSGRRALPTPLGAAAPDHHAPPANSARCLPVHIRSAPTRSAGADLAATVPTRAPDRWRGRSPCSGPLPARAARVPTSISVTGTTPRFVANACQTARPTTTPSGTPMTMPTSAIGGRLPAHGGGDLPADCMPIAFRNPTSRRRRATLTTRTWMQGRDPEQGEHEAEDEREVHRLAEVDQVRRGHREEGDVRGIAARTERPPQIPAGPGLDAHQQHRALQRVLAARSVARTRWALGRHEPAHGDVRARAEPDDTEVGRERRRPHHPERRRVGCLRTAGGRPCAPRSRREPRPGPSSWSRAPPRRCGRAAARSPARPAHDPSIALPAMVCAATPSMVTGLCRPRVTSVTAESWRRTDSTGDACVNRSESR